MKLDVVGVLMVLTALLASAYIITLADRSYSERRMEISKCR